MYNRTVEEIVCGLPNEVEVSIEFYHDYDKTRYYTAKQVKKRKNVLMLKVVDFDYDYNSRYNSVRIIVED